MKGMFIGKDAMGFKHRHMYHIKSKIQMVHRYKFNDNMMCICIYDVNSNAWCPYESLEAVLRNWILDM